MIGVIPKIVEAMCLGNVRVYHYNAFSTELDKGNPAGVVLEGNGLTERQMMQIARQVGFNETAFVQRSDAATLRLRYFTPGHEINLCGHATIATLFALRSRGLLENESITVETNVGILPMRVTSSPDGSFMVTMKQASPEFVPFEGSLDNLAASIGLTRKDIDDDLPVVYGSTGIWTLLLPIKKLEAFSRMTPRNEMFPCVLEQMPRMSVHPFCLETCDPNADMHARHFSSPNSGTVEDPVTGTASGVMGAYYKKFIRTDLEEVNLVIQQGFEIRRNGSVLVHVNAEGTDIQISGSGVYVSEFDIENELN